MSIKSPKNGLSS